MNQSRIPPMDAVLDVFEKEVEVWKADDLNGDRINFGLQGSPTKLKKIFTPKLIKGKVQMLEGTADEAAGKLIQILRDRCII